ncbi:hypothetical protein GC194_05715 [bacterium]|nr:hypothetical protein [bacterium]
MPGLNLIYERLQKPVSKLEITALAREVVLSGHQQIHELIQAINGNKKRDLRLAWLLENIIIPSPQLHQQFALPIADKYLVVQDSSVMRILGKILAETCLPEERYDELYVHALEIIESEHDVAAKVHAARIAAAIAQQYPELFGELMPLLENEVQKNSVAFQKVVEKIKRQYKNSID